VGEEDIEKCQWWDRYAGKAGRYLGFRKLSAGSQGCHGIEEDVGGEKDDGICINGCLTIENKSRVRKNDGMNA